MAKLFLGPILLLATAGLVISCIAHLVTLLGGEIPGKERIWALHVGIFIVWPPALLVASAASQHVRRKDLWKAALAGCPAWMRWAITLLFVYNLLHIAFFFATFEPRNTGGKGALPLPEAVRVFSCFWMTAYGAAYGAACGVLYSRLFGPRASRPRVCPNDHAVPMDAEFCPACGARLVGFGDEQKD